MRPTNLRPPTARPRKRVIFVLAPLSSTKHQTVHQFGGELLMPVRSFFGHVGSFLFGGGQSFFMLPAHPAQPQVYGGRAEAPVQTRTQFGQRHIGLLGEQFLKPALALLGEQRAAPAAMSPRLQRAALLKLLAHTAHRRHAKTKPLRDFACAFASLVELEDPPAYRNRHGRHALTLSQDAFSV
jgi:hypothetical protein